MRYPPCDVCGAPADYLWMDPVAAFERKRIRDEFRNKHAGGVVDGLVAFKTMMEAPVPVLWSWLCRDHAKDGGYEIEVGLIDTLSKALEMTFHVLKKEWVDRWSWEHAMRDMHFENGDFR